MTVQLEHPIWSDDEIQIHCARLIEQPASAPPGSIEIRWLGAGGEHALVIMGNDADDVLERYRAAPDPEAKEHVIIYEIKKAAAL